MLGVIIIDDEIYHITKMFKKGYLPMIETEEGEDFYLAEDSDHAGVIAANYWEDMIHDDPKEFICMMGEERLLLWVTHQNDSFGICGLDEFKEAVASVPEAQWASYDNSERHVKFRNSDNSECGTLPICSPSVIEELGFIPYVAYRCN